MSIFDSISSRVPGRLKRARGLFVPRSDDPSEDIVHTLYQMRGIRFRRNCESQIFAEPFGLLVGWLRAASHRSSRNRLLIVGHCGEGEIGVQSDSRGLLDHDFWNPPQGREYEVVYAHTCHGLETVSEERIAAAAPRIATYRGTIYKTVCTPVEYRVWRRYLGLMSKHVRRSKSGTALRDRLYAEYQEEIADLRTVALRDPGAKLALVHLTMHREQLQGWGA